VVEIKFCGMTRAEDVGEAVALGANYVGAILAPSPRRLAPAEAKKVLAGAAPTAARVAVFGSATATDIVADASAAGAKIVQLHGDPTPAIIAELRALWHGKIWAVVRVSGASLPSGMDKLFDAADAVVLDARVDGALGGTGVTLAWDELAPRLTPLRQGRAKLVLAGGLSPENVARAIAAIGPDVVDVSSGVESSVGVKDHARMRAFRDAVRGESR